jgi:hypothetical protein
MYVIGIDPGPVVGIVRLQLNRLPGDVSLTGAEALQVTPGLLTDVLNALGRSWRPVLAVERFVTGPRAARSSTPSGGKAARDTLARIQEWVLEAHWGLCERSASEVKPWATDTRLAAAGLLEPTHGMRHARDGARHALFCAVKDYGLPDPLSAKAGKRCTGCGQTGEWTPSGCARCGPVQ